MGVKTIIDYVSGGVDLVTADRKALMIGPAVRVFKDKKIRALNEVAVANNTIKVNVPDGSNAGDLAISNILKPDADDKLSHNSNLVLYVTRADGSGKVALTDSNFLSAVSTGSFKTNYNDGAASKDIITFDEKNFIYDHLNGNGGEELSTLTITDDANSVISDDTGTVIADNISRIKVGDTFTYYDNDGTYVHAKVLAVNTTDNEITIDENFMVGEDGLDGTYVYYIGYDYHGGTIGTVRGAKIYADLEANRTGKSGRYNITNIADLEDLFGIESLTHSESLLAYDAMLYLSTAKSEFTIYVMTTDEDSDPVDVCLNNTEIASAQAGISALDGYFYLPSYRIETAGDVANVKSLLGSYVDLIETQIDSDDNKYGYLFGALPILNVGNGYTNGESDDGGVDLSSASDYGKYYINLSTDATNDYESAQGQAGNFDSEVLTLVPYYAYVAGSSGLECIEGSAVAAIKAGERARLGEGKNLAYCLTKETAPALIAGVPYAEYFTTDQLEGLANAGWQMFEQNHIGGPTKVYRQCTTSDTGEVEKEEHLVIANHALAQAIKLSTEPYIAKGINNQISSNQDAPKTKAYLAKLNNIIAGARENYVLNWKIFSAVEIISAIQSETNVNKMLLKIKVSNYFPVTDIEYTIISGR